MNDETFLCDVWRIGKGKEYVTAGHLNTALHQSTRYLVKRPRRDPVCARAHRLVLPHAGRNKAHRKADVTYCDRKADNSTQMSSAKGVKMTPSGPTVTEGPACRFTMAHLPRRRAQHLGASTARVTRGVGRGIDGDCRDGAPLAKRAAVYSYQSALSVLSQMTVDNIKIPTYKARIATIQDMCVQVALVTVLLDYTPLHEVNPRIRNR